MIKEEQNDKRFFVDCFYSIDIDKNRLICENGKDFSGLMINPEILLSLGINRVDVVYLDHHGYWKRYPDYMDMQVPGVGRTIHNDCIKYVKLLILRILKTGISLEAMPPWVSENGFSSFQAVC